MMLFRICLFVGLAAFCSRPATTQPTIWSGLDLGPHAVGFESTWEVDLARRYRFTHDERVVYGRDKAPRPLLVNVWYPAVPTAEPPMAYREYLDIAPEHDELEALAEHLVFYTRDVMAHELFDAPEADLTLLQRDAWDALLAAPTAARRSASAAAGPFPLVVFHSGSGSSFEDNAGLHEYLASHGFVVVSSAFLDGDGTSLGVDGNADSVLDLDMLIRIASRRPGVDASRVAVGGHSVGAQVAMKYQARGRTVADALFLLDTTQDNHSVYNATWSFIQTTLDHADAYTVPMLVFAEPTAVFQLMDRLTGADRTYVTVANADHNEYLSQGVFRQRLAAAHRIPMTERDGTEISPADQVHRADVVARRYRRINEAVLAFLTAHLVDGAAPPAGLDLTPHPDVRVETVPAGEADPPPYALGGPTAPTPRQLRRVAASDGVAAALVALDRFSDDTPAPPIADKQYGAAWVFELLATSQHEAARAVYSTYEERHGDSVASSIAFFCRLAGLVGRTAFARECYGSLSVVAPDHVDPAYVD